MSAYADVGKFHFTSGKARYFTMCGSTVFHVLRKQSISLYVFVSANTVLVKKKDEEFLQFFVLFLSVGLSCSIAGLLRGGFSPFVAKMRQKYCKIVNNVIHYIKLRLDAT